MLINWWGFLGVKPLSGYFEERRGHRGGKELLSEKSAVPPLIVKEYMLINSFERDARNDGWKAGMQAGMQAGIAQGRSEGFSDGLKQTAKILKQLGDSTQKIMQATGLSQEEVEALN